MTAIAALQCVERGQFTLDEDVTRLLPELRNIDTLKGFEEGYEMPIFCEVNEDDYFAVMKWIKMNEFLG